MKKLVICILSVALFFAGCTMKTEVDKMHEIENKIRSWNSDSVINGYLYDSSKAHYRAEDVAFIARKYFFNISPDSNITMYEIENNFNSENFIKIYKEDYIYLLKKEENYILVIISRKEPPLISDMKKSFFDYAIVAYCIKVK